MSARGGRAESLLVHSSRRRSQTLRRLLIIQAVHDQRGQGDAPRQLLDVTGEFHRLELRHLGELQRLCRRDNRNPLGDLKGLLQLFRALGAEELVDGSLRLLQVSADHAESGRVEDHGDGERHQADDNKVQAQATVGVGHAQGNGAVFGPASAVGGNTGVASTVLKGDQGDVQVTVSLNLPLLT